nr:hypothetical protein Iba_chr05cCG0640 [Ipomoea batatas]
MSIPGIPNSHRSCVQKPTGIIALYKFSTPTPIDNGTPPLFISVRDIIEVPHHDPRPFVVTSIISTEAKRLHLRIRHHEPGVLNRVKPYLFSTLFPPQEAQVSLVNPQGPANSIPGVTAAGRVRMPQVSQDISPGGHFSKA